MNSKPIFPIFIRRYTPTYFLSNFYECPISVFGMEFRNAEAAFHSQKDVSRAGEFTNLTASAAKRLGRQVTLRKNWEQEKKNIMFEVLYAKFNQNKELKEKLIKTGNAPIIEDTTGWNDLYWGAVEGLSGDWHGENNLGILLERVRELL